MVQQENLFERGKYYIQENILNIHVYWDCHVAF